MKNLVRSMGKGEFRSMPGGNKTDQGPIIMENGKVIHLDQTMIGTEAIQKGLEYISKIAEGLATGTMAMDEDYLSFRQKAMADLIESQAQEIKKNIETEEKKIKSRYGNAATAQEEALQQIREQTRRITEDNKLTFYVGEDDDILYHVGTDGPVGAKGPLGGRYKQIDFEQLKQMIEAREARAAELRAKKKGTNMRGEDKSGRSVSKSDVDTYKKTSKKKAKKKTTKKATKKSTTKKKIAKKKVKKARKSDRK